MKQFIKRYLGPVLVLCGTAFMAIGVWADELEVILAKAVRICLECIGIG